MGFRVSGGCFRVLLRFLRGLLIRRVFRRVLCRFTVFRY